MLCVDVVAVVVVVDSGDCFAVVNSCFDVAAVVDGVVLVVLDVVVDGAVAVVKSACPESRTV